MFNLLFLFIFRLYENWNCLRANLRVRNKNDKLINNGSHSLCLLQVIFNSRCPLDITLLYIYIILFSTLVWLWVAYHSKIVLNYNKIII